ncbi:DUF2871 domain-containing protein [Candidatus Stoquefichus massiliensis]|uniref:DUF2871 domain-containing protein n=1 Tax=Candidatus Stoquefichus massiliensis TaxID=1470350 RepID=UPI000484A6E3|nr:DUF2871 domain-containing protein [Candidatus Stoquefichus massiliensis]
MKKLLKVSLIYVILALIGGVFYREFTKFNGFTGVTRLADIHVHLMVLGTFMFMILALFAQRTQLLEAKKFKLFMILYNIGLGLTVIMMSVRGITQVLAMNLSKGLDASISGMAGIGHILLGISLILLMTILMKVSEEIKDESNCSI